MPFDFSPCARATVFALLLWVSASQAEVPSDSPSADRFDLKAPPHSYLDRPLKDPFTRFKKDWESGVVRLNTENGLAFLKDLLARLGIPESSQMLVFSTTSLQLSLITPANPRAIYFNEELYVGYIPGGKIEIVSIDPELGAVFYIFTIPGSAEAPVIERSGRCMNCHSGEDTGFVPGLVVKSVIPGQGGGTIDSLVPGLPGHAVPLDQRFGGWFLTGQDGFTNHWGNSIGKLFAGDISRRLVKPGEAFNWNKYPVHTSDLLPHLLHEHQVGFINLITKAIYASRTALFLGEGKLSPERAGHIAKYADELVAYLLFKDEAVFPVGGFTVDESFKARFEKGSRGQALRQLDLKTRLFKYRCSYMVYSQIFRSMPEELRMIVFQKLASVLQGEDSQYNYLPAMEREKISETLSADFPDMARHFKQAKK